MSFQLAPKSVTLNDI